MGHDISPKSPSPSWRTLSPSSRTPISLRPVKSRITWFGMLPLAVYSPQRVPITSLIADTTTMTKEHEFTWIWTLKVPNKIKNFLWLLHHERIPTNKYLYNIGINISPSPLPQISFEEYSVYVIRPPLVEWHPKLDIFSNFE